MNIDRINAIKARLQAATMRPWKVSGWRTDSHNGGVYKMLKGSSGEWIGDLRTDCEFIAHAPDDIRELLAECSRLRCELADSGQYEEPH